MSTTVCPVCGGQDCTPAPVVDYLDSYPLLPGGREKVPGREGFEWIAAPHPIPHPTLEVIEYGQGDRVPMAVAVERGLVAGPLPEPAPVGTRGARRAR